MSGFFDIYDALAASVASSAPVLETVSGPLWCCSRTAEGAGLAMSVPAGGIEAVHPTFNGIPLCDAAKAAASWNFQEAGLGLASANAFLNTPQRVAALRCAEPFDARCTRGLDFSGKTVGVVGHMRPDKHMNVQPRALYILERDPQPGDYPDSACDYLLPQCDVVFISGSTLVNKTLPHLLELCRDAYTILLGPSVPLCPALLDFGIDRLSGLAVTDAPGVRAHTLAGTHGTPYIYGTPFLLTK